MAAATAMSTRLSSFVGRKKELAELRRLLPHTRLLTLLGPGGAGKTRLAQEFVARVEPDRSVFAELGDVADGALVVEAIARAAGARLEGRDPIAALTRQVMDRRVLVVDNCEHVVEAAADVISRLLAGCPNLSVIATSRERLNVEGEMAWHVPALGVPDAGDDVATADASDAARLFVDRARGVRPGFVLDASNAGAVLAICRRLDGIPLAIELAAARVTTLSPKDIVPRLEDSLRLLTGGVRNAASRQQTLRATIDWSYALLDPNEQRLLHRMSVFAGAPDADAVQEVCAFPPLDRAAVLDALTRLVDKSMVQVDASGEAMRYRLLETIREYAAERLAEEARDTFARDRHLARYQRLTEEAYMLRRRRGAAAEHRLLWREMNDMRVALDWARSDSETELRMLGNLYLIWVSNAPVEGYQRITEALERAQPSPSQAFMRAVHAWNAVGGMTGLGWALQEKSDWVAGAPKILSLAYECDDKHFLGTFMGGAAYAAERQGGNVEAAHGLMTGAVELFETLGPGPQYAMYLGSLGSMELQLGRPERARELIGRSVAMTLDVEDDYGTVGAYFHLGHLELQEGSAAKSRAAFLAGLDYVEAGDTLSTTGQVQGLACALVEEDPAYALRLFGASGRLRAPLMPPGLSPWDARIEQGIADARAALKERDADAAWASGDELTVAALLDEILQRFQAAPASRRQKPYHGLSRREMEIADLVANGMTSRAIAEKLFLSERTVETHLTHVMTKLGFNSRAQVAAWVAEQRAT